MKITLGDLQKIIQEVTGDLPKEFSDSLEDEAAGYISIFDPKGDNLIAQAPIVRTDGPDRPYLVRTTDTHWEVEHWIVELIYPQIEEIFNHVDSELNWNTLNLGSAGKHNGLVWKWEEFPRYRRT